MKKTHHRKLKCNQKYKYDNANYLTEAMLAYSVWVSPVYTAEFINSLKDPADLFFFLVWLCDFFYCRIRTLFKCQFLYKHLNHSIKTYYILCVIHIQSPRGWLKYKCLTHEHCDMGTA